MGSIPDSVVSPGGGNGNPLQYSCLENPMDRGAWWATVHRVSKSQTLSQFLGRLINPESPRRREWSGALEEGIEVLSSQGGEKNKFCFFFKPRADDCTTKQLILLKDMFSLKLCTNVYVTTMYPARKQVSPF